MFLIDTNVFLELFLGQRRARECEALLGRVAEGQVEAVVTVFSMHAAESVLNKPRLILTFLRNIIGSIGLAVYDTSVDDEMAAAMLMEKVKLDYDDALQYYVARKLGVEAIVSYDRHLDRLDLPRKEPRELVQGKSSAA